MTITDPTSNEVIDAEIEDALDRYDALVRDAEDNYIDANTEDETTRAGIALREAVALRAAFREASKSKQSV